MKKFVDPLPQGGIPFFANDFVMLQSEFFRLSLHMYSSLGNKVILSGCVPNFTDTVYPTVKISGISAGYIMMPDEDNGNIPEIFYFPGRVLSSGVDTAYLVRDAANDDVDARQLKIGGDEATIIRQKRMKMMTATELGSSVPNPDYSFKYNPLPVGYLKDVMFRHSKKIGEIIPIGLLPTNVFNGLTNANPTFGKSGIPLFTQTTTSLSGKGLGLYEYEGFALCNGLNNTPNLEGRFMAGYSTSAAFGHNIIGSYGGAEEVKLYVEHMPAHNHMNDTVVNAGEYGLMRQSVVGQNATIGAGGVDVAGSGDQADLTASPVAIAMQGGSLPHENRPPYYTTLFIQRIY